MTRIGNRRRLADNDVDGEAIGSKRDFLFDRGNSRDRENWWNAAGTGCREKADGKGKDVDFIGIGPVRWARTVVDAGGRCPPSVGARALPPASFDSRYFNGSGL